jgi:hypothetical protein
VLGVFTIGFVMMIIDKLRGPKLKVSDEKPLVEDSNKVVESAVADNKMKKEVEITECQAQEEVK